MLQAVTPNAPCKVCGKAFIRFSSFESATVCGVRCAQKLPVIARNVQKRERAETKKKLEALEPIAYHHKLTQKAFNAMIRARDIGQPCISCQKHSSYPYQAGHYKTVGGHPELRYDEANVHAQCVACNLHAHGAPIGYRFGLQTRISPEELERIEGPQAPKKYTAAALETMRAEYRALTRQLLKERQ